MLQHLLRIKRTHSAIFFCLLTLFLSLTSTVANAYNDSMRMCPYQWRPIIAIAGGYITSSGLADSHNFPIQNPITDSFYNYSGDSGKKTTTIGDAFLGFEFGFARGGILQLGLGYDQTTPFGISGALTQGADVISQDIWRYQYDIVLRQFLFEGKFLVTAGEIYHPYVFGGVGTSINTASNFKTNIPTYITFTREYDRSTNFTFSYSVGFGLDLDLDRVFRLGVGYRYSNYGTVELGNATINQTQVPGTISQSNVQTSELFLQLTAGINY